MGLGDILKDVKVGNLLVLRDAQSEYEWETVGYLSDPQAYRLGLSLEDPASHRSFHQFDNLIRKLMRGIPVVNEVPFVQPKGSRLRGKKPDYYSLSNFSGYSVLQPTNAGNNSVSLANGPPYMQPSDIVMLSNPELNVVGFVADYSSKKIYLGHSSSLGLPSGGPVHWIVYNIRNFNTLTVLRKRPT